MAQTLAEHAATFKSDLADAAKAGQSQVMVVLEHGLQHLMDAAKGLHPDIAAVEAELKPLVADVIQYAFGLMPGSMWLNFLEPRIEDFINHQIDVELRKLFPAAT